MLVDVIEAYLRDGEKARVVVELPLREAYQPEIDEFRERMGGIGLRVLEEGEEVGFDDWGGGKEEVRCWWGVWGWREGVDGYGRYGN